MADSLPECFELAKRANALKFHFPTDEKSNILERLEATGERELIDAAPRDRLWGIGFSAAAARQVDRQEWGQNLYGKAIMEIRRDGIPKGDAVIKAALEWKKNPRRKIPEPRPPPSSGREIDVSVFDLGGSHSIWW